MRKALRYASSFIVPVVVCIGLPLLLLRPGSAGAGASRAISPGTAVPGAILIALGLVLSILSFRLIMRVGEGTIMPWDPTRKLVIVGLYRFVRNPMILSILIVLVGEALVFGSEDLSILANTLYFRLSEEPGLEKRFGEEYLEYKRNVPRWIPRVSPWAPRPSAGNAEPRDPQSTRKRRA